MPTVNLRRFSEPDALREIAPAHLLALLEPHREFFAGRGLGLPPAGSAEAPDYVRLAEFFLCPDDVPAELVEKLHLVKQMSAPETMDKIIEAVNERQLELRFAADSSPADIAAQLFLRDRSLFQELHAQKAVARYRGFTYFVARNKPRSFRPPKDLSALEKTLNGWYEAHQRGRSARVFWREHGEEFWFYVRHAEPIKREGSVDLRDNASGSQIYRPEHHDLVVYDARAGELRVHGDCPQEPELFRLAFGLHLFGEADFFPKRREKYTLEPLKTAQRRALAPAGVAGILAVTLKEVEYLSHGAMWSRRRVCAEDVFSVFEAEGAGIPAKADIRMARFAVVFSDVKKARMFTIRPSNYAVLGRDDDAVPLQEWLQVQGFAKQPDAAEEARTFELTSAE